MEGELYRSRIGHFRGDDADVGTAYVIVTREANGYAVWYTLHEENNGLMEYHQGRDAAIERGVALAAQLRKSVAGKYVRDDWHGTEEQADTRAQIKMMSR